MDFLEKSNVAFRHLYLKCWDPSFETMPYPPATGAYAIYTIPEFYSHVDYALKRVSSFVLKRNWLIKPEFFKKFTIKVNIKAQNYTTVSQHQLLSKSGM